MRKSILSLILLLCPIVMFAQNNLVNTENHNPLPVKHFEGEVLVGFTAPLGDCGSGDFVSQAFGYEFRYNIDEVPLDFSAQVNYTSAAGNETYSIAIFGDWNFGQGQRLNPFVGMGIGWAQHESDNYDRYYDDDKSKPIIIPRVGIELFRHFRLTLSSNISGRGYNNLQLSIGVVFGGGLKKN